MTRMLWDRYPELPYTVWAPWPQIIHNGHQDWEASVELVHTWLVKNIGNRWVEWTWGWATFSMNLDRDVCTVNFKHGPAGTLFLLKFSDIDSCSL